MEASTLCSLSTVSPGGRAHINHMYFAWGGRFEIFWISDRESNHSRHLARDSTAAITIYDSHQTWGGPDRGIQLFGTAREATGRALEAASSGYKGRFPSYDPSEWEGYPLYRFRPRTVKLFDEPEFGGATFVTAGVTPAGLRWIRTEVSA